MNRSLLVLATAMISLTFAANAASIEVPGDYSTIEEAIAAAMPGDAIMLAPGVYTLTNANGIAIAHNVSLIGSADPADTTINALPGTDSTRRLLQVAGGRVEGITFSNAYSKSDQDTVTTLLATDGALVTNCVFTGTKINARGYPVLISGSETLVSSCEIRNTTYSGGNGWTQGKGIVLLTSGATMTDCAISNNTNRTRDYGTISLNSNTTLRDCIVSDNHLLPDELANHSAGITVSGTNCLIEGCVIKDNLLDATASYTRYNSAGGIYICGAATTVRRTVVSGNRSVYGYAGGIVVNANNALLENLLITENSSGNGYAGGLYMASSGKVYNCTISKNVVDTMSNFKAHGIYIAKNAGNVDIQNTIVYGNISDDLGSLQTDFANLNSNARITYSCLPDIFELTNGVLNAASGVGCLYTDPFFADPLTGDFRLAPYSPCKDAGTEIVGYAATDILGTARPIGDANDIGCYEAPLNAEFAGRLVATPVSLPPSGGTVTFTIFAWPEDEIAHYEIMMSHNETTSVFTNSQAIFQHIFTGVGKYTVSARIVYEDDTIIDCAPVEIIIPPTTTYVSTNGSNTFPYSTPETAASIIQDAISAVYGVEGERGTVIIAPGDYGASHAYQDTEYMVSISKPILLYGNGSSPQDTVIDGESARHILSVTDSECVVSNVTLANAFTDAASLNWRGYAAHISGGRLDSCVITNCLSQATKVNLSEACVLVRDNGTILRTDICGQRYVGNNYSNYGLLLYVSNGEVSDSRIFGNITCDRRAGAVLLDGEQVSLENCDVFGNVSKNAEYKSYVAAGVNIKNGATMRSCRVFSNENLAGAGYQYGGGVSAVGGVGSIIDSCVITNNSSGGTSASGFTSLVVGGVIAGKGTIIRNCLIAGNYTAAGDVGGIALLSTTSSGAIIENCTVYGNSAVRHLVNSGILSSDGAITNCIVYGNGAILNGTTTNLIQSMEITAGDAFLAADFSSTNAPVGYTCTSVLIPGIGNIAQSPKLMSPRNGDFRFRPSSPCLRRGIYLPWIVTDITGKPRRGTQLDLGCYAFDGILGTFLLMR